MGKPAIPFDAGREEAELRAYLGDGFELRRLREYERQLEDEYAQIGDETELYRRSEAYLYNLTAFAMTATKLPYLQELVEHVPPGARILDYGCGIGSDGLLLLEAGYRVEFADFENPSTAYLRWRLERRGLSGPIHDIDRHVPGGFDAAYAFDVIEHVPDAFGFLDELERRARLVEVNLLEPGANEPELHRELPIAALLRHVCARRVLSYRILHGRSHLVLYASEPAGRAGSAVNRGRFAAVRLRRALTRRTSARA